MFKIYRTGRWLFCLVVLFAARLSVAQDPTADPPQSYAGSPAEEFAETDQGDDLSATVNEEEEQGFETEPPGSRSADKSGANPGASAFKSVFYDNDFSYLNQPGNCDLFLGDCWKLMPVGECGEYGTLDVGGQLRLRYHHEVGMGQDVSGPGVRRFENTVHDILLSRFRLYGNWQANDYARVYIEGIFAEVTDDNGTYLPRPIDINCGDFLNAFIDYELDEGCVVRVGRQELLYGAERLISPLDWANTRRTFEGVKMMTVVDDWKVDGFFTHHVPVQPYRLDEADYDQPFYGVWGTYGGWENKTLDLFYIGYDNNADDDPIVSDFSLDTFGSRLFGERGNWLYELEGGLQIGRQSGLGLDQSASYGTAGMGRRLPDHEWKPTVWFYYDYASGNFPGGDFNRFNQLFPLGHKYFGFIDAVQRSNIESPNVLLTMQPAEKWNFLVWYWYFLANSGTDIVPSLGGTPTESLSRTHFGDELDLLARYAIGSRSYLLFGYSHFWRGDKILAPQDADFFYTQWELNF